MACVKCGKELHPDFLYCPWCGKKQVTEQKKSSRSRPNGTGSVYKRGKTWQASVVQGYVVGNDGKMKTVRTTKGGFRTKKEAMEYLPTLRNAPTRKVPTLLDLWGIFQASKKYL